MKEDGEYVPDNLALSPDKDNSLLIAIMPDGEFLLVVWNPLEPSKVIYYREKIGMNWSDLTWTLGFAVNRGTLFIDNYRVPSFDGAK